MEAGNAALKLPDNLSEAEQKKAGVQLKVISGGQGGGGAAKEIKPGQTIEIENEIKLPANTAKLKPRHLSAVPDQPVEEPESENAEQPASQSGENEKPSSGQSGESNQANNTPSGGSSEPSNNQTTNGGEQSSDQPAGEQQSTGEPGQEKSDETASGDSAEDFTGKRIKPVGRSQEDFDKEGEELEKEAQERREEREEKKREREEARADKKQREEDRKQREEERIQRNESISHNLSTFEERRNKGENQEGPAAQERENKKQQEAEEDQAGEKKPGDKEKSAGEGKKNPNEITNEDEAKDAQAQLTKNQRNAAGEKNKKDEDANKKAEAEDEQKSPDTTKIFWAGWLQGAWIDYISWLGLDFISLFFIIMPNWVLYYWGGILRLLSIQPGSEWFAGGAGGKITGLKKIKANFFMRLWLGLSKYLPWLASLWTGFLWFILLPCLVYLLFSCEGQKAIANTFDGTTYVLAITVQMAFSWVGLCF